MATRIGEGILEDAVVVEGLRNGAQVKLCAKVSCLFWESECGNAERIVPDSAMGTGRYKSRVWPSAEAIHPCL